MIGIKITNVPSSLNAKSWYPILYLGGSYYLPPESFGFSEAAELDVDTDSYHARIVLSSAVPPGQVSLYHKDVYDVVLEDGKVYTFDYTAGKFAGGTPVAVILGCIAGAALLTGIILAARR
ncbi:MAG: hypothetical protein PHI12_11300 [Dehalococcoidales bacterium]|nr:hypothetical protein [Dehalococcoidales bacterium]